MELLVGDREPFMLSLVFQPEFHQASSEGLSGLWIRK
jgi:hypothetical protein